VKKADLEHNHDPFDQALTRYRGFMERIVEAQRVIRTRTEKQDIAESALWVPEILAIFFRKFWPGQPADLNPLSSPRQG
jgi:hypothetical protein